MTVMTVDCVMLNREIVDSILSANLAIVFYVRNFPLYRKYNQGCMRECEWFRLLGLNIADATVGLDGEQFVSTLKIGKNTFLSTVAVLAVVGN